MPQSIRVPVTVVTGYLGSGKTTLINKVINGGHASETAFIVNEFGEISIDSDLIETADENMITLRDGCVCCSIRSDLAEAIQELITRRSTGEIAFSNICLETTGLADPGPILHTLMRDPRLSGLTSLNTIVTVVSATHGPSQLEQSEECHVQIGVADRIVVTKADVAEEKDLVATFQAVRDIAPSVPLFRTDAPGFKPEGMFAPLLDQAPRDWLGADTMAAKTDHTNGITAHALSYNHPIDWPRFSDGMDFLTSRYGDELLRLKGILQVKGVDQPVVVHGVHHLMHPPVVLPGWPDESRASRLVCIARGLNRADLDQTLAPFIGRAASHTQMRPKPLTQD